MVEERNDKSLCEKSMKVVVNIIKLSSFSIAKLTLGEATARKGLVLGTDSSSVMDGPMQPTRYSESRRLKPYSFVVEPGSGGDHEPMMVRKEKRSDGTSDGKFAAYIRKVHEKNRRNSHEASKLSPYILPPPPTPLRRYK